MRLLALLAAGLFAGSLMAADDKKDEKSKDEELIIGSWKVEKFDSGDPKAKAPSDEDLAKMRVTFEKGGKMVSRQSFGGETKGEYKLDPAAKPKTIDLTETGITTMGVYELDGDTLKMCVGKARPGELKADGKGSVLMVLKRVKEEKKDK